MKVLIVNHRGDIITSGVEQWLIRLAQTARAQGIELYAALPEHGPLETALLALSIPVKVVEVAWQPRTATGWSRYMRGLPDRVASLAAWIEAEGIELVHTNTLNLFEGALAAMRSRRPHIWHVRSTFGADPEPYGFGGLALPLSTQARLLAWLSDGILSVSASTARAFVEADIPVQVLHNGIDIQALSARAGTLTSSDLRAELGLAAETALVAYVGRVSPEKDLPTFVEACNLIHATQPGAHFLIIGNTDENPSTTAQVRRRIGELGLEPHFHLLGQRHDMPALYAQFDLLMLTSLHEGLSNVLLEAMASGIPVVSTRCGGPEAIVEDGRNGLLAEVGDAPGLARAALRYLTDRRFAQTLAEAGRERIAREFCQAKYVTDLAEYYATIKTAFSPEDQARRQTLADGALALARRHADLSLRLEQLEQHLRPEDSSPGRRGIKNFVRRVYARLLQPFRGQGL